MGAISFTAMDSAVGVEVVGDGLPAARALRLAFIAFAKHERALDESDPAGEVAALNRAHGAPAPVSPLLFQAVRTALAASAATEGLYQPLRRLEPLVWPRPLSLRPRAGGTALLSRPSGTAAPAEVLLDQARMTVELPAGAALHLRDIGAALAADAATCCLKDLRGYRIDVGADVRVGGLAEGGAWRVAVADPRHAGGLLTALHLRDGAVATAAPERPGDGDSDVLCATVMTGTLAGARAFARAAAGADPTTGFRLLETHCLAGLLALRDGRVWVTERMRQYVAR